MGPHAAGLEGVGLPAALPRWQVRLERTWGVSLRPPPSRLELELARCVDEWDAGLARIEYPEVTAEDRATFLERVVCWQVRRALGAGRFDLALALTRLAPHRIAQLAERLERRPLLRVIPGRAASLFATPPIDRRDR